MSMLSSGSCVSALGCPGGGEKWGRRRGCTFNVKHNCRDSWHYKHVAVAYFLGVFHISREKRPLSFVASVCPSVHLSACIITVPTARKSVPPPQVWLKSDRNVTSFTQGRFCSPYEFAINVFWAIFIVFIVDGDKEPTHRRRFCASDATMANDAKASQCCVKSQCLSR